MITAQPTWCTSSNVGFSVWGRFWATTPITRLFPTMLSSINCTPASLATLSGAISIG